MVIASTAVRTSVPLKCFPCGTSLKKSRSGDWMLIHRVPPFPCIVLCWLTVTVLKMRNRKFSSHQWRAEGGFGRFNPPPPRNSEGPPKSCQTQPDCENC